MICLRPEVFDDGGGSDSCFSPRNSSSTSSHGLVLPVDLGGSIQRYLRRSGRSNCRMRSKSFSSGDGCSTNSDFEEKCSGREKSGKLYTYRSQLEQDIERLQKELEEEIQLHLTLANAIEHCDPSLSDSSSQLPDKAKDLLGSITLLETTVEKLEGELIVLQHQLHQERNERHLAEYNLRHSSFRASSASEIYPKLMPMNPNGGEKKDVEIGYVSRWLDVTQRPNKDILQENLWHHPNQLSEEMVLCMIDIFISLSISPKDSSSQNMASPASPMRPLSYNSAASSLDSPLWTSPARRSSGCDLESSYDVFAKVETFDPYRFPGKLEWLGTVGAYNMAVQVCALSVGKKELIYAAGALKRFRFLVEQLAKLDPSRMTHDEKLAFWINLYNALIMHAYLAYGIPRSDVKFFSLMQKAMYTVGGQSFSAAEIEYIMLKMKPPPHRPHIALCLALHEFKELEVKEMYSIDQPEPLLPFALSCGTYSSPAVRIFKPGNVADMLRQSLKDYVRASVGISNKGQLGERMFVQEQVAAPWNSELHRLTFLIKVSLPIPLARKKAPFDQPVRSHRESASGSWLGLWN
ncbi:uncharacterized protein LOC115671308 isoform X2 [Syzygium oleosum]|uniref:uncharacterized protein LOC115671308 isoform X2 n=1 Tax=Syzygium oleosum TaxID=219896 RepID=UPI0024BAB161|nr:uncharacterized protein LOC115671308 isoform X2 [Syzygium oleosum]